MNKTIILVIVGLCLFGCGKYGVSGKLDHWVGNWAAVSLPAGCVAKQIAVEEGSGMAVLCEDGRLFH